MIRLIDEKTWIDVQLVNDKGKVYTSFPVYDLTITEARKQLETENSVLRKRVDESK